MDDFYKCKPPYPQLCMVWDEDFEDRELFFSVIISEYKFNGHVFYLDHNDRPWKNKKELDVGCTMKLLSESKRYDYLTVPPDEKDFL